MKSMTGFGRGVATSGGTHVLVEISSVNRKQSDINIGMPRELGDLENALRRQVGEVVSRGRVSVRVSLDSATGENSALRVDHDLAKAYRDSLAEIAGQFSEKLTLTAGDLLRAPGVFVLDEPVISSEELQPALEAAAAKALRALDTMRAREGRELKKDIGQRLKSVGRIRREIAKDAPGVAERYRGNLIRRLAESGLEIDLDDERVLKEVGIFAEKCDVSEELTRLESHLGQFATYLVSKEPVGREMDFLAQELNREINTIGSKGNSASIAKHVVAAKAEVEKIREQVQNVE